MINSILAVCLACHLVFGEQYLYDLEISPYESDDIFSNSDYADQLDDLKSRTNTWASLVLDPEIANTTNKETAWNESGGVVPWITTTHEPVEISQIYDYSNAPHIIFVFVDDWGYNDVGYRSTYMNWTTPTIDKLASEGLKLENYYTYDVCTPSRGALLTGRYVLRLGLWDGTDSAELPLSETTLAQELKSAGYRTHMVGKWHLGLSTESHLPINRGFDSYYGFLSGFEDHWNKTFHGFFDLTENDQLVTNPSETTNTLHNGYLFETKAETVITDHAANYPDTPLFLYYAMQLIHGPWTAPRIYSERCQYPPSYDITDDYVDHEAYEYCGMNVMLDEAIANLTCTLAAAGMSENTVLMIVSDNGGESTMLGNSLPFRGHKGSFYRGGVSATAIIHSTMVPESVRGTEYHGQVHVTDWLPTLMGLATNGAWTGSYSGAEIDGQDMWDTMMTNQSTKHEEIVHYVDTSGAVALQVNMIKFLRNVTTTPADNPQFYFTEDLHPSLTRVMCNSPTLVSSDVLDVDEEQISRWFMIAMQVLDYIQSNWFVPVLVGLALAGIVFTLLGSVTMDGKGGAAGNYPLARCQVGEVVVLDKKPYYQEIQDTEGGDAAAHNRISPSAGTTEDRFWRSHKYSETTSDKDETLPLLNKS